jgi:predicted phosphodiesterase
MRLAILADIHGNLPAFEAALRHLSGYKPDGIVLLGDIVNGAPDSSACWQLAESLGCPILRGNHERYVSLFGTPDADPGWSSEQFAPLHWTVEQFSEPQRQGLRALPACLRLPEAPDLLLVHASARGDYDIIVPYTPEAQLQEMFPGVSERWVVRGHNHLCQVRLWERGVIITSGSVGMPLDGNPTAQYLLLDRGKDGWNVQHQSVTYSLQAITQRFESSGYLKAAGPMARLYLREIQTGSPHIVPFLRAYHHWRKELSLSQAVERFFAQ